MDTNWNDENIQKALKGRVPESGAPAAFERAWSNIEAKIQARQAKPSSWFSWNLGAPSMRLAGAALLLFLAVGMTTKYRSFQREGRIASYLEAISDPSDENSGEEGFVRISALLSESLAEEGVDPGIPSEDNDVQAFEEEGLLL